MNACLEHQQYEATARAAAMTRRTEMLGRLQFLVALLFPLLTASLASANSDITAHSCTATNNNGTNLQYQNWGINMTGTNNIVPFTDLWCSIPNGNLSQSGITLVHATVYDRNESMNFPCTLYITDDAGNIAFSGTQSTSGLANGWSQSPVVLAWTISTFGEYASINCQLPQQSAAHGMSHLSSFWMQP